MEEQGSNEEVSVKEDSEEFDLTISEKAISSLEETRKWTKFLSVLGFIFVGFIVVVALSFGSIFSSVPIPGSIGEMNSFPSGIGYLITFVYLVMGLIYFFPTWYLFKFSTQVNKVISQKDNDALDEAFGNHKSFYKFFGVFSIIFLSLYAIFGLIGLLTQVF